ncbi:hypothetical protein K458DRAFT_445622 [Lentithecium fluviatile CBS 122367]|uniref:Acid protease n=1 Tax=Lentithecium fluviatile CBS 122367 TaxID=1168545 RepID=A0A6G1IP87_9PLEO|nr:hypothetical protein K458DRAFT_445622 [Lentithecium fluviatile CBS 122367]
MRTAIVSIALPFLAAARSQCDTPPLTLTWTNTTVTQDGLGVARGIELSIGTPRQIFAFRPITALNNTRINNVLNCGSAANNSCVGELGGTFDPSKSESYAVSMKSQWNGTMAEEEDGKKAYVYLNDEVGFQGGGSVEGFPLVMSGGGGAQSGLSLGTNSSFLRAAVAGGVAPSEVFGLWSGSRGVDHPRDGQLFVGGYDRARVGPTASFSTFPVAQWSLERACPLQVTITDLRYAGLPLLPNGTNKLIACIEPAIHRLVFPPEIAEKFANYTSHNPTAHPGRLEYDVTKRPTDVLTITLSNGYSTGISNEELFAPLRTHDENGRYAIINDRVVEAFVADTRGVDPADVDTMLGGLFLTFNYLIVDYAKGEFKLASAVSAAAEDVDPDPTVVCTPSNTPSTSPWPPTSPKSSTSGGGGSKNGGMIVGAVVGSVAAVALLGSAGFLLFRRRGRVKEMLLRETYARPHMDVAKQPLEMMANEVHELPTSRQSSFRKLEGWMRQ